MTSDIQNTFKLDLTGEQIQKILNLLGKNLVNENYNLVADGLGSIKFVKNITSGEGLTLDSNNKISLNSDLLDKINNPLAVIPNPDITPGESVIDLHNIQVGNLKYTLDSIPLTVSSVEDVNVPSIRTIAFGNDKFSFLPTGIYINSGAIQFNDSLRSLTIDGKNYSVPSLSFIISDEVPSEDALIARKLIIGGNTYKFYAQPEITEKSITENLLSDDILNKLNQVDALSKELLDVESTIDSILGV